MKIKGILLSLLLAFALCFTGCSAPAGKTAEPGDSGPPEPPEPKPPFVLDPSKESGFASAAFQKPSANWDYYTSNQASGPYALSTAVPTDAVWVYGGLSYGVSAKTAVKSYAGQYGKIGFMCSLSRDYTDADYGRPRYTDSHRDIIQREADGGIIWRGGSEYGGSDGAPHVYPSEGFALYIAGICKDMIDLGASVIALEEPDGFAKGYNGGFFKAEWQEKYSGAFSDGWAAANPDEFNLKRDTVISDIFINAYRIFIDEIKGYNPGVEVVMAAHPTFDYALNHHCSANNFGMFSCDGADGFIIQAWTDTVANLPVYYQGSNRSDLRFEQAYVQYSEGANFINGMNGKRIFSIADAAADTPAHRPENVARPIWQETVVAQLMMPQIYSYESMVWPDRAWRGDLVPGGVSREYRAVQEGVIRVQNDMHNYGAERFGGTRGIGVVMSYTAEAYTGTAGAPTANVPIYSMAVPLLKRGVPVDIISLESLLSIDALKDTKILVLSYDFIKPEYWFYNATVAEWVDKGGVLVYAGGENEGQDIDFWWKDREYGSPQAELFARLGLGVTDSAFSSLGGEWEKTEDAPAYFADVSVPAAIRNTAYAVGGGVTKLFERGGETLAFEKRVGKGAVVVAGCEPGAFSADADSYLFYEMLLKRACELAEVQYQKPGAMYVVRGPYEIYHTFASALPLEGEFIDLFDDHYAVRVNPTIPANTSALYVRVSGTGVGFSNGEISDSTGGAEGRAFTLKNAPTSMARTVVKLPGNVTDASVTAVGKSTNAAAAVAKTVDGGFLHIVYPPPSDAIARFDVQVTYIS
ncbi:MAG: hypothetical protein LBL66_02700 [Clostridiales bacterium]|jgi:hypothetical protein|nr:hypothetical protein [Clostridiales bacterium]